MTQQEQRGYHSTNTPCPAALGQRSKERRKPEFPVIRKTGKTDSRLTKLKKKMAKHTKACMCLQCDTRNHINYRHQEKAQNKYINYNKMFCKINQIKLKIIFLMPFSIRPFAANSNVLVPIGYSLCMFGEGGGALLGSRKGGFSLGSLLGFLLGIRLAAPVMGLTECFVQYVFW